MPRTVTLAILLLLVLLAPTDGAAAWDRFAGADGETPVAFSPDGSLLVTTSADEGLVLWEFPGLKQVRTLPGSRVVSVAFSPDGRRLATGRMGEILTVWDVPTGRLVWKNAVPRATEQPGAQVGYRSVAFDPTGRFLITSAGCGVVTGRTEDDPCVRWWDSETGGQLRELRGAVRTWSADGRWLTLHQPGALDVVSSDGAEVRWSSADRVSLGFEGQKLYVGARDPESGCIQRVVEVDAEGKQTALPLADVEEVLPGGLFLRSSTMPRLELVDRSGSTAAVLEHPAGACVSLSLADPQGRFLVLGELGGQAWIWDCRTGRQLHHFDPQSHDFAVSPDGRFLVSHGWNGLLQVLETSTWSTVATRQTRRDARR